MTRISDDPRSWAGVEFLPEPPPELTDEEAAEFAVELGRLWNASEIELARETGERIIKRLFSGSVALYRKRNTGSLSLTKVVEYLKQNSDEFKGWNRSRVDNSVIVYDLGEKLGGFKQYDNLTVTHVLAVAGLDLEEQKALLSEANATGMTANQLEERVRSQRKEKRRKQGKDLSLIRRALSRVGRLERVLKEHEAWMPEVTATGFDEKALERLDAAIDVCAHEAQFVEQGLKQLLPPPDKKSASAKGRKGTS